MSILHLVLLIGLLQLRSYSKQYVYGPVEIYLETQDAFFLIPSESLHVPTYLLIFSSKPSWPSSTKDNSTANHNVSSSFSIFLALLLSGNIELNPGRVSNLIKPQIKFKLINTCSMRNKAPAIHNFLIKHDTDILAITETWLKQIDTPSFIADITPSGFSFVHQPRLTGAGGGVGFLFKSHLKFARTIIPKYDSFEAIAGTFTSSNNSFRILNIYRPPSSNFSNFLNDFQTLIESLISVASELIITGDFNIHMDEDTLQSKNFLAILDSFGLKQHVQFPTQNCGHTLDLLINREDSSLISNVSFIEPHLSDHLAVTGLINIPIKYPSTKTSISFRNYRKLNKQIFCNDINMSDLYNKPAGNANDFADQLHSTVTSILDKYIPIQTKTVTKRSPTPWINQEILNAKKSRNNLERQWRKSRMQSDKTRFCLQRRAVIKLINSAKSLHLTNIISSNISNPRNIWRCLNSILHRTHSLILPEHSNLSELCSKFLNFFTDKITHIRSTFPVDSEPHPAEFPPTPPQSMLDCFNLCDLSEIKKLIFSLPNKECLLDSLPTALIKDCFDTIGPLLVRLINLSLSEGIFPTSFKNSHIFPLLKKHNLPPEDLSNFRPISNLNYVSKLLERIVAKRLNLHLSDNSLFLPYQSAYRRFHSTETALLKINNDIACSLDRGEVTGLILLDLSAAFDTIDHSILLHRLQSWFGVTGIAAKWFASYLSNRSQQVNINGTISPPLPLQFGVPQGSVLGPLLFTLYTTPLGSVISDHSMNYHLYADDTQLYISFKHCNSADAIQKLSATFSAINSWMTHNKLLLNPSKTEFLVIGTPGQRAKFKSLQSINLGNTIIKRSESAKNLGVIIDSDLSFTKHITNTCKTSYMHIRDIRRIRHMLPKHTAVALANALVSSRLDYCNSLYYGVSQENINKLQRVQNSLARAVTNTRKYDHITPVLKSLHWLPIKQRITFKLNCITFKTLTTKQPVYLYNLLPNQSTAVSKSVSTVTTRSTSNKDLNHFIGTKLEIGKRAYTVAGPKLWNALPTELKSSETLSIFRKALKTYLFIQAYPP